MFERYTENARRALFFARYEASQLGDLEIKVEHLLLGLVRPAAGVAARILAGSGISVQDIRREVERRSAFAEKVSTSVEIPFNGETKRALQFAADEADGLRHAHIGTEHLLLGILREGESAAAAILIARGLRLEEARDAVRKWTEDTPSRSAASHRTEASALIHGINQLLERLAAITSNSEAARPLIAELRERVAALERLLGE
jgi:ATP-dependent Clp protease ATP-binding subunit ClpC